MERMADLAATFDALAADASARCTLCGRCAEICPTAREVGVDRREPPGLVRGLIDLAQTGADGGQASRTDAERRAEAARRFRTMSHAVRLLASMQMPSAALQRIVAPAERRR